MRTVASVAGLGNRKAPSHTTFTPSLTASLVIALLGLGGLVGCLLWARLGVSFWSPPGGEYLLSPPSSASVKHVRSSPRIPRRARQGVLGIAVRRKRLSIRIPTQFGRNRARNYPLNHQPSQQQRNRFPKSANYLSHHHHSTTPSIKLQPTHQQCTRTKTFLTNPPSSCASETLRRLKKGRTGLV